MNEAQRPGQARIAQDILVWRQQLIHSVLRVMAGVGLLALVVGSYTAIIAGNLWVIPFYGCVYVILIGVTFGRVPYMVRAAITLGLIYGLGVLDLIESGRSGDGRLFLLALPFAATLFFDRRVGILALGLNVVTMVAIGWAFSAGLITLSLAERQMASYQLTPWLSNAVVLLMLGSLLVLAPDYLMSRLGHALAQSRELVRELETQQARLSEQTQTLRERETELAQRTRQLQAMLEVTRLSNALLAPDELLQKAMTLLGEQFDYPFIGVFTPDARGQYIEWRAGHGEIGPHLAQSHYRLELNRQTAAGWAAERRQMCLAQASNPETRPMLTLLLPAARAELALPLVAGNQLMGVLDVQSFQDEAFDRQARDILQGVADELAAGLRNALRLREAQKTLGQAEVLYEASRRLTTAATPAEVAEAIIQSVAETGADGCVIVQFDFAPTGVPEALVYLGAWRRDRAPLFRPGLRLPMSKSPFPFDLVSQFWMVADVEQDESLPWSARQVFKETEARALVNIPLHIEDKVIGQVVVVRATPGPFSEMARRLYEMLSDQAAVALERARLLEETRQRAAREKLIGDLAARVRAGLTLEQVLQTAVREIGQTLGAARVAVQLKLADTREK